MSATAKVKYYTRAEFDTLPIEEQERIRANTIYIAWARKKNQQVREHNKTASAKDQRPIPYPQLEPQLGAELEAKGWEVWVRTLFPHFFTRPFTQYQKEFWEWGWQIESNRRYRPRIECEPRGVGKSTNAEVLVVNLLARQKRKMIGYVSLEEGKAGKHFDTIRTMLESEKFLEHYPHCQPKVQKLKDTAAQWSRDAIVTTGGAMVVPLTLLGSSRGWKSSEGHRFDVIVLDDIDKLGQSTEFTTKLIELLKGEILAAGDDNTVVIMPQNLIYRDSICSQIRDHRADILSDRVFCGPYPLLKWYDAEKVDIEDDSTGAKRWTITAGEAFDPAIDLKYAENLLNNYGKALFDRECQQLVTQIEDDKDFREWNEIYHIITVSEWRAVMEQYGEPVWNENAQRPQIPLRWHVGLGMDWGTTRAHPAAVMFTARPGQNCPLHTCHFAFAELLRPEFPTDSHQTPELVSPGRVAQGVNEILESWGVQDSQISLRLMSHEASAAQSTMAVDLPKEDKQFFGKWKAKRGSGVPQIQSLLEIDYTKAHPFRRYPQGYKINRQDVSGLPLKGSPRWFFIVDDSQGELLVDELGNLFVAGAKDAKGFARVRFEFPIYNHRNSGQKKIDDDITDAALGLMNIFGVDAASLTKEEAIQSYMPKHLVEKTRPYKPEHDLEIFFARQDAQKQAEKEWSGVKTFSIYDD